MTEHPPARFFLLVSDGSGLHLMSGGREHRGKDTLRDIHAPEDMVVLGAVEFNDYGQIHGSSRMADPAPPDPHVCSATEGITCLYCQKMDRAMAHIVNDFKRKTGCDL